GAGLALHAGRRALRRWARVTFVLGALGLLAPGLWPAGRALLRKARVVQQLPEVAAFDGPGDAAVFRTLDGGEVAVVPPPSVWREATRGRVGEITFHAGFRNPRLLVDNPFASWAGYQALMISLWSPEDAPFEVVLRIDDEAATLAMDDRFHRRFALVPGPNELRIPLADIRLSPTTRELDLGDLENLVLFMDRPARDHRLFVERLWLE
ncbi:MAG: hypothetical protein KC731_07915, partial [Myxococcales bacterium]|nr:hypothetical protein [Myxococcales bacterium]